MRVNAGESIRITTPRGGQAADFFAYNADDTAEWLSPNHTWVTTFSVKPRVGDVLISRFRNPMLRLTTDNADGVHDMMIAACDQKRYAFFGFEGYHRSCSENLVTAMAELEIDIDVIPQPVNFFTNTRVDERGNFLSPPNPVPAGASVELEALIDLVCVVSSCPFDLPVEGWTINANKGPTELMVEVF